MIVEIKIPMVGLLSLSMAYSISRLETDCTGMGSQIKHLIKIYAYPNIESVNTWKREIANKFLSPFGYATRSKAKPDRVEHWMFGR